MLRRSKLVLLGILCISLLPVVAKADKLSFDQMFKSTILEKYINKDEKDVKLILKQLSKKQIIEEINSMSASLGQVEANNELLPFVGELFERKNEFDNSDIIEAIKDSRNSKTTQAIMIDLYAVKNENNSNQGEIKKLLKDNLPNEVKAKIVANATFLEEDIDLLKNLVEEENDILAFQSLKKLSKVNSEEAYKISKNILSNYKNESKDKVSAAQKATIQYLKDNKLVNKEDKESFIALCYEIINSTEDVALKDSSTFALSDLRDAHSIISIIKNPSIDRELKVFSIDQNFMTLNEILLSDPSESNIEAVVQAMEILPISDLIQPLEEAKNNISNDNLRKRCDDVLASMKLEGRKGNIKWLDKNNN